MSQKLVAIFEIAKHPLGRPVVLKLFSLRRVWKSLLDLRRTSNMNFNKDAFY